MRKMSVLRMMEAGLPPGFRFHPRDEELICDYLEKRISGNNNGSYHSSCQMMIDVDLNKCEPWDLPEMACVGGKEWYFFNHRDRKYTTGQRTNRATQSGYWKATGKDRPVTKKGVLVGMRKTLVFYQGRAPKGEKTDWIMHEFRMETTFDDPPKFSTKDWVLSRVFFKSRSTSPNLTPATMAKMAFNQFHSYDSHSSSLPAYINFDHAHGNQHQTWITLLGHEQETCFSNTLAGPTTTVTSQPAPPPQHVGNLSIQLAADVVNCGRKMIKEALSNFSRLEEGRKIEASMSFGDGGIESYLSPAAGLSLNKMKGRRSQ